MGGRAGTGNATGAFMQTGDIIGVTAPLLAPLGHYGGPVKTMALHPGSPARDAAAGSAALADQRGFPIVGTPDIGAYEAGTLTNYAAFIWETLPATATDEEHLEYADYDGDGAINFDEWTAGTVVTNPASVFRLTNFTRNGDTGTLTFPTVLGRTYTFESSTDLVTWLPIFPGSVTGTGNPATFDFGGASEFDRLFLRARVSGP